MNREFEPVFTTLRSPDNRARAKDKYVAATKAYCKDKFVEAVTLLNEGAQLDSSNQTVKKLLERMNSMAHFLVDSGPDFFTGKYDAAKKKVLKCKTIMEEIELPNKALEAKLELKLSLIEFRTGDRVLALTHVQRSLDLNPNYIKALLHRAHLYRLTKNWEGTLKDLEKASQLDSHLTKKPYRMWITEARVEVERMRK